MILEIPVPTLVTVPDEEPIVATPVLLLTHVPPVVALVKVTETPVPQTPRVPEIGDNELTVIAFNALQPLDKV